MTLEQMGYQLTDGSYHKQLGDYSIQVIQKSSQAFIRKIMKGSIFVSIKTFTDTASLELDDDYLKIATYMQSYNRLTDKELAKFNQNKNRLPGRELGPGQLDKEINKELLK